MEEMGSRTARMAEELRAMQARAEIAGAAGAPATSQTAAAPDVTDVEGPMQVSISVPENASNPMDGVSVHISIGAGPSGAEVRVS